MTKEQVRELSNEQLSERTARHLGYHVRKTTEITGDDRIADGYTLHGPDGSRVNGRWLQTEASAWSDVPSMVTDPACTLMLMEKLADPRSYREMFALVFERIYAHDDDKNRIGRATAEAYALKFNLTEGQ